MDEIHTISMKERSKPQINIGKDTVVNLHANSRSRLLETIVTCIKVIISLNLLLKRKLYVRLLALN